MRGDIHGDGTSSARTSGGNAGVYWYDPATGRAWPFDGHYGGDDKLIKLRRVDDGADASGGTTGTPVDSEQEGRT